ncbi:MAG: hypothetical protein R3E33_00210 [Rhodocyclaceae bacterium]
MDGTLAQPGFYDIHNHGQGGHITTLSPLHVGPHTMSDRPTTISEDRQLTEEAPFLFWLLSEGGDRSRFSAAVTKLMQLAVALAVAHINLSVGGVNHYGSTGMDMLPIGGPHRKDLFEVFIFACEACLPVFDPVVG